MVDRWDRERCTVCERDMTEGGVWCVGIGPVCFDCDELRDDGEPAPTPQGAPHDS